MEWGILTKFQQTKSLWPGKKDCATERKFRQLPVYLNYSRLIQNAAIGLDRVK